MPKLKEIKATTKLSGYYSWFFIGLVFVISLVFITATFTPVTIGARGDNVAGWAWSPFTVPTQSGGLRTGFGFTSFNDCYCFYDQANSGPFCRLVLEAGSNCTSDIGPGLYGLSVNFSGKEITGWAWAPSVGWICFGRSCSSAGAGRNYDTGRPKEIENPDLAVIYGDTAGEPAPITGWAKIVAWPNDKGWLSLRGDLELPGSGQYGLTFSTTTLEIKGLAWNGFRDPGLADSFSNYKGYGWFCIGETTLCPGTGIQVSVPFLQTVAGDIYVRDSIAPDYAPLGGLSNATYLILSGGTIERFISEELYLGDIPLIQRPGSYVVENYPLALGLPRVDQNYFNLIGSLDVPALLQEKVNAHGSYEKYSGCVNINQGFVDDIVNPRVIIDSGGCDTTLGPAILRNIGATTVIIKGNLSVVNNVSYDSGPVSDFADMPSVSFIVEGDMFISPGVTNLAGNFVVLGRPTGSDPAYNPCPVSSGWANATGCGAIYTGASNNNILTSYGIMMARKFFLERTTADVVYSVAEKIIYDGRLLVNPPPGFKDLSKALPVFSQVPPQ